MRKILITFSGSAYNTTTKEIVSRAPSMGADKVLVYDEPWLMQTSLYRDHHWLWTHHGDQHNRKRGFGWFAFKPFCILDAISRMDDGDICLWLDADTYPVHDFSMLYDECARIGGILPFKSVGWEGCHNIWCKRDCFIVMEQDEPRYWYADHGCARFALFQKGASLTQTFLEEWLKFSVHPLATTFDPSTLGPEVPSINPKFPWGGEFHEHRCEQAILTNLCNKYRLRMYREACQFGESSSDDKDLYPTLFFQDGRTGPQTLIGSAHRNIPPVGLG